MKISLQIQSISATIIFFLLLEFVTSFSYKTLLHSYKNIPFNFLVLYASRDYNVNESTKYNDHNYNHNINKDKSPSSSQFQKIHSKQRLQQTKISNKPSSSSFVKSNNNGYNVSNNNSKSKPHRRQQQRQQQTQSANQRQQQFTLNKSKYNNNDNNHYYNNDHDKSPWSTVDKLQTKQQINDWMEHVVSIVTKQPTKDHPFQSLIACNAQQSFLKALEEKQAYHAIYLFTVHFAIPNIHVYNTAFNILSKNKSFRIYVTRLYHEKLVPQSIQPTLATIMTVLNCIDGPDETIAMMRPLLSSTSSLSSLLHKQQQQQQQQRIPIRRQTHDNNRPLRLTHDIIHSAMYACGRRRVQRRHNYDNDDNVNHDNNNNDTTSKDWQTALFLYQQMQKQPHGLIPTDKTYIALLQVFAKSGQVRMAISLMNEILQKQDLNILTNERIWGTAIHVCAQAGDYKGAISFFRQMKCHPNVIHFSGLLKACAKSQQDQLALQILHAMTNPLQGNNNYNNENSKNKHTITNNNKGAGIVSKLRIPPTMPDLVILNTVLSACAKARNFVNAHALFLQMENGNFTCPTTNRPILPDIISYNCILSCNQDPELAKELIKKMRLSRRYRVGAVPPSSISYAHAIHACQQCNVPNLSIVRLLLDWACDDAITPTVYMYTSAIWTAERLGDHQQAMTWFRQMQNETSHSCRPNTVTYTAVISALANAGKANEAIELYCEMKSKKIPPSAATFQKLAFAIRQIENVEERVSILESFVENMHRGESVVMVPVIQLLITNYDQEDRVDDALSLYYSIKGPTDGPCLRAILLACSNAVPPRWEDALSIMHCSDIVIESSGPGMVDQIALGSAVIACCKADEWEEGFNLLQLYGMPERTRKKQQSTFPLAAMNALIVACGRGGRPDMSIALLRDMQSNFNLTPDQRSFRGAIIACNQAQHDQSRRVKQQQQKFFNGTKAEEEEEEEDHRSLVQWWECSLSLLRRMKENGLIPDVQTYSSVISACEAAGEWQRALGVLQTLLDTNSEEHINDSNLNLYCFNAAISACEKGGAWVEALDLYERMVDSGGSLTPNFVTMNSLLVALDNANQKELAQSIYEQGRKSKIINPWRNTINHNGEIIRALDLHQCSAAMAKAAIRSTMESYLHVRNVEEILDNFTIIVGKGLRSTGPPVLMSAVTTILEDYYGITPIIDKQNNGRVIVNVNELRQFVKLKSYR